MAVADWAILPVFFGPPLAALVMFSSGRRSLRGGEVYAVGDTMGHAELLREFFTPTVGMEPGMVGLQDCEGLFARLPEEGPIAEHHPDRYCLSTQTAAQSETLGNNN